MRVAFVLASAFAAFLLAFPERSAAATSPTQVLTLVDKAGLGAYRLRAAERAIERQVEAARRFWAIPEVRFGRGGWPVTIVEHVSAAQCGVRDADGCHGFDLSPWGIVGASQSQAEASDEEWQSTLSHEVLEMLTNPDLSLFNSDMEICDLTSGWDYLDHGVWLSDFALPEAYAPDPQGRVDFMRALSAKDVRQAFAYEGIPLGSLSTS